VRKVQYRLKEYGTGAAGKPAPGDDTDEENPETEAASE
jgi:hypothetical protein